MTKKELQSRRNRDINQNGTLGHALRAHSDELNRMSTKDELMTFIDKITPEVTSDPEYLDSVKVDVRNQPFMKSYQELYDILLKGEGLSIKYLQTYEKKDSRYYRRKRIRESSEGF